MDPAASLPGPPPDAGGGLISRTHGAGWTERRGGLWYIGGSEGTGEESRVKTQFRIGVNVTQTNGINGNTKRSAQLAQKPFLVRTGSASAALPAAALLRSCCRTTPPVEEANDRTEEPVAPAHPQKSANHNSERLIGDVFADQLR
ncbi:Hypothetical protein SMAX5B_011710 [Scophthalmus maximus]|uniref:Uncharacterized protein n=1 Tax=Scophthalmus maximus TaxID=52904 RepID=A0A2U9AXH0_SCOMX|nr:Hypothetical protein SMAX5B_011710 [Scophthalmus maximus]